jgi:hypothetical protein
MMTRPLFSTSDELERARAHERAVADRVAEIAHAYIRVHALWREAELEVTKAALQGRAALKRKIADLHHAQLEELKHQSAVASAALALATSARVRAEAEVARRVA